MPSRHSLRLQLFIAMQIAVVGACSDSTREHPAPLVTEAGEKTETSGARSLAADEAEQLKALGYVDVVEEEEDDSGLEGVVRVDEERMQPSLTYYTKARGCSSHHIDERGREIARWEQKPCEVWGNSLLRPNGDVIASVQGEHDPDSSQEDSDARKLLKFDSKGNLL